jgi:hypothetical protein
MMFAPPEAPAHLTRVLGSDQLASAHYLVESGNFQCLRQS